MGPIAARKAAQILEHVETIVVLELLCAAQGIDLRRRTQSSLVLGRGTLPVYEAVRQHVPFIAVYEVMYPRIEKLRLLVKHGTVARAAEQNITREF